ncbi:MAG: hypothetical protein GC200_08805 [Tepidisphaera sp.]|nr:hypothetical protein [Tepidisphaera sp.]
MENSHRGFAGRAIARLLAGVALAGAWFAGGCRLATPFRASTDGTPPAAGPVVVAITHAQLDPAGRDAFDRYTDKVIASLPSNAGYLGYSVRGRLLGNEVWTMTLWRDHAATDAFVRSSTHGQAIREGLAAVKRAQFLRFEWPAADPPPSWDEIDRRLEHVPFIDYTKEPA